MCFLFLSIKCWLLNELILSCSVTKTALSMGGLCCSCSVIAIINFSAFDCYLYCDLCLLPGDSQHLKKFNCKSHVNSGWHSFTYMGAWEVGKAEQKKLYTWYMCCQNEHEKLYTWGGVECSLKKGSAEWITHPLVHSGS